MYASTLGLILNVTLNTITIYGLGMGTEGAALATVAGRIGVLLVLLLYVIFKKMPIDLNPFTQ
jgi:Na+-driven multidrug efflux pump